MNSSPNQVETDFESWWKDNQVFLAIADQKQTAQLAWNGAVIRTAEKFLSRHDTE